jgi:DNA-directed RNA polymerase subunit RPC12/RpoP
VVVLNNPSEQIRECLQHAEECAREAAELPNSSSFRQEFVQLEKRWLELARSIEFGEQLDGFTKNSANSNHKPNPLKSATMLPFGYRCPDCGWDIETLVAEITSNEHDAYQSAVCPNCQQLHSVNPANGEILVEDGFATPGDRWPFCCDTLCASAVVASSFPPHPGLPN